MRLELPTPVRGYTGTRYQDLRAGHANDWMSLVRNAGNRPWHGGARRTVKRPQAVVFVISPGFVIGGMPVLVPGTCIPRTVVVSFSDEGAVR